MKDNFTWLKQHADTLCVMGTLLSGFVWMNAKFNNLELEVNTIKTVMIVKGIMPCELAKKIKEGE